jgi:hypothetical protein
MAGDINDSPYLKRKFRDIQQRLRPESSLKSST